jgi:hypothetical protein
VELLQDIDMPRPGYIICSVSGAIDSETGFVSAFQIIKAIPIVPIADSEGDSAESVVPLSMRVVATWIKEASDAGQRFEGQIVGLFPGETAEIVFGVFEPFTIETPIYRFIVPEIKIERFPGGGILFIEGRLRRVGETEWMARLSFPIAIEEFRQVASQKQPQTG